jgi:hypothetical protein
VWGHGAWDWLIVAGAYLVGLGFFQLLGGLRAASEAIQRWGRSSATKRIERVTPQYARAVRRETPGSG